MLMYGNIFAHANKIKGRIFDKSTGKGIRYAIIRIPNSPEYTSSNSEGYFEIHFPKSKSTLISSCIGYKSDTSFIDTNRTITKLNIFLSPAYYNSKFTNIAGKISADEIVSHIISEKEKMLANLDDYNFNSYLRCVVRENNEVGLGTGSLNIDPSIVEKSFDLVSNIWKDKPMKIDGIDEFVCNGYYRSPDTYNEIIEGKNSHSRLPNTLRNLLGTRSIQNLSADELLVCERPLPGPMSKEALSYYKYSFKDTLEMDDEKIYVIHFEPIDKNDPGLMGNIYASDSTYCLLKIEANLNKPANAGNAFDRIALIQQYICYNNKYYLPIDYRIFANSNFVGVVKINYDYSALIRHYNINSNNNILNINDEALIKTVEDKERDSVLWADQRAIPFTPEEETAYDKIDSIRSRPKGFIYKAAQIFSPQYRLNNHFSISGPLSIYQFNHVEGNTISFTGAGNNLFDNSLDARLTLSNGFSDKRFKQNLSTIFFANEERSLSFSLNVYNKIETLFSSSDRYNSITTTIYSLLSKHDFRSYYYTKGFDFKTSAEVFRFISIFAGYSNHVDQSAKTNTTFSLFGGSRRNFSSNNNFSFVDSVNPPIYDTRLNTVSFGINFDFRNDALENNLIRRVSNGHSFITFGAGVLISDRKYLGSYVGFTSYNANILSEINTFGTSSLGMAINAIYSNGPVPIQMQYALPGNISATSRDFSFRTLGVGKMFGDQVFTLALEYNLRKELYRVIPISILQNINLSSFFNAAWKNMSTKSAAIMPIPYTVLTQPLLEAGFSIGYSSLPINLEFAWRLTHIDRSGFQVGINTSIL